MKNAPPNVIFCKRKINADHRQVVVDDEENESGHQHDEKNPVLLQFMEETGLGNHSRTSETTSAPRSAACCRISSSDAVRAHVHEYAGLS